jgi:Protein of unknown function (DUF1064)
MSRDRRESWAAWIKTRHDGITVNTRPSTNKYQARAVRIDGILFDSQREAARYQELSVLVAAGLIRDLEIHPGFPLQVVALHSPGPPWTITTVGMFHADFRYFDCQIRATVVEDVKSKPTRTEAYQLRKRMVEATYGITIREIT